MNMQAYGVNARLASVMAHCVDVLTEAGIAFEDYMPSGSAFFGSLIPNDYDVAFYAPDTDHVRLAMLLGKKGWSNCGQQYAELSTRLIMRKLDMNLFVFNDYEAWVQFAAATLLAKEQINAGNLSVADKEGRVRIFQILRGE